MSRRGRGGGRKRWGDSGFEGWTGGYMGAKKAKLEDQFNADAASEGSKGIFDGVAIFVNGYTDPSADELKRIMMMNGGIFHHYFNSRKTTHIIATNLPDSKVKALKGNEPICSPKWVTDSLEQKKLLNFTDYLLYSNQSKSQPKIQFEKLKKSSESVKPSMDAKDPKFLEEFYNNSRLHHISTMGANFKRYVNDLRENSDCSSFPERLKLKSFNLTKNGDLKHKSKIFMHIDMDCFFVSVGLRKRPELRGKPVAVAHAKGAIQPSNEVIETRKREMQFYKTRDFEAEVDSISEKDMVEFSSMSELASCSYEARAKGVKNGMFLGPALSLCPELQTIPYDFEGYQEVAHVLYDTVAKYTLNIQAVSCDEMLVDITEVLNDTGIGALDFANHLRKEIFDQTQCNASVGMGSNLLLARMATRKAKPDGSYFIQDSEADHFMRSVPVRDLPGIGRKIGHKFSEMEVESCADLQKLSLAQLKSEFGAKNGEMFYKFCRGIDSRDINLTQERKSVSAEVNYGIRFNTEEEGLKFLDQLSGEVQARLEKLNTKGKCITLKLMVRSANAPKETSKFMGHGVCDSMSKSSTLSSFTRDINVIKREAAVLIKQLDVAYDDIRGIGIQVSKLDQGSSSSSSNVSMLKFVTTSKIKPDGVTLHNDKKLDNSKPSCSKEKEHSNSLDFSFSQIDPEVLAELPKEIQEEFKHKAKPLEECNQRKAVEKAEEENEEISFSQVDPEFLAALPEDIQREVEESMKQQQKNKPKKSYQEEERGNESKSLLDATFSQVDEEYMNALPEEIAKEVRETLNARRGQKNNSKKSDTAFDILMKKSPAKNVSATPTKRRRGRPPKNSPRFIKSSKNKTKASTSSSAKALFVQEEEIGIIKEDEIVKNAIEVKKTDEEEQPNLEGKTNLNDLREIIRQWIKSCSEPTNDDTATVSNYFLELVFAKKFETLILLLKLFKRKASDKNKKWKDCFTVIESQVQSNMLNFHGYKLLSV